jgi:hypothetical protein
MQPWASLIVGGPLAAGTKRVENRTWHPPLSMIGQRFAIHASKKLDMDAFRMLAPGGSDPLERELWPYAHPADFPRAAIIGMATLACSTEFVRDVPDDQLRWWSGPVGFLLRDVQRIDPIADVKGALGFWTLPDDVEHAVHAQSGRA